MRGGPALLGVISLLTSSSICDDDDLFGPVVPYSPNVCIAEMSEKEKLEHKRRSLADKESIKKCYSRIKEQGILNNILKVGTCLGFCTHLCTVLCGQVHVC